MMLHRASRLGFNGVSQRPAHRRICIFRSESMIAQRHFQTSFIIRESEVRHRENNDPLLRRFIMVREKRSRERYDARLFESHCRERWCMPEIKLGCLATPNGVRAAESGLLRCRRSSRVYLSCVAICLLSLSTCVVLYGTYILRLPRM